MLKKQYQFAHTKIEIHMPEELPVPENMKLFQVFPADGNVDISEEGGSPCEDTDGSPIKLGNSTSGEEEVYTIQKTYELEIVDNLASVVQQFCAKHPDAKQILRKNMQILVTPNQECRVIRLESSPVPYAVHIEESPEHTKVWVRRDILNMMEIDTIFGSLLGLEKVVLREGAMILHSAYMCREGKAVLFSAPSETGKSTQAGLWEKYRGTRQVNGDRSLLVREGDGWYAYGWPICGSSEICHNEAYPIQAIVMLYQAKENTIQRLGPAAAMKKLMSQITINMWNTRFQIQVMDLIQQLITEVPVYELGCNISEDAVACLERVL